MATSGANGSETLAPFKYESFPVGSIQSSGWLGDQLQLSANGLGGHLFDFYRYVARSTWLGGTFEYSELHESAPYWFNYIVPLAWTLNDERLKQQAKQFLDYVLDHQAPDGWLGPETTRQTRGIWARSLLCFGLVQYAEADPTHTDRIVTALHKFVVLVHDMLQNNYTGLIEDKTENDDFDPYGFGLTRTHELPISLQWLYDNHPRNNSKIIWETAELMFSGGRLGLRDWTTFFVDGVFPTVGTPLIKTSSFTHGVNLAQGLRYPTVLYRMTKNPGLIEQTYTAVNLTATYQTSDSGTIVADEHLGGRSPERGSELCMSVESMFSYAYLYRFHGANDFADRAERAAFNALPAAISPDWWSHQYVTQTNQPWSKNLSGDPFFNVVPYGNTYGLEPNFPCCTVNHPQAYPKFVASSYAKSGNGIVHMLLAPTTLRTKHNGKFVEIECDTNYPFSGTIAYTITSQTRFSFSVRVPGWVSSMSQTSIAINNGHLKALSPDASSLQNVPISEGTTKITINLPLDVRVETRNNSAVIFRGPLLYAADIQYNVTSHQPLNFTDRTPLPDSELDPRARDYVLEPTSPWQFAIDPSSIKVMADRPDTAKLPNPVFTRDGPPTALVVDAYPISWAQDKGTAGLPPTNPTVDANTKTTLRLIPFGAAKLHIAEFPIANITTL
ncbi:hypothetical protein BX600DRAFT_515250 [Xylariales sp. PMI_506]|nr:hypothetical protein BX600DRAFT_515250 [Xylariales sp. PMI_506]